MIILSKKEKKLVLSSIIHERNVLSDQELAAENMSEIILIEAEIKKQAPTLSPGQFDLILTYLDVILESKLYPKTEIINLQHKIIAYLQKMN